MAYTWGPVQRGSYSARIGTNIVQSPATVTASTSSVTVTAEIWLWTEYRVQNDVVNLSWSGNFGSGSVSPTVTVGSHTQWATKNRVKLRTLTRTVSPSYASAVVSSLSASLSSLEVVGKTLTVSASHSTAARPVSAPAAPTGASVVRSSDTGHTVRWTRNATTAAPYEAVVVQRWDNVGGAYRTIATVSGAATSYADRSTVAGRRYRWRVAARNKAGTSSYSVTPYIYTTPAAPTGVRAVRAGADVQVSWTPPSGTYLSYSSHVYRRPYGTASWGSPVVELGPGVTSWTDTAPDPATVWEYGVRAVAVNDDRELLSTTTSGGAVQLLSPPLAPVPETGVVVENTPDKLVPFRWTHTSTDGTAQRRFELQWRPAGVSSWTTSAGNSDRSNTGVRVESVGGASAVEWRVRTWGDHADPSPWSPVTPIRLAGLPSATIRRPDGDVLHSATVSPWWEFYDPEGEGQRAWAAEILDSAGTRVASGSGATATVWRPTVRLENGETYRVRVRVRAFSGLWSEWAEAVVRVEFLPPPVAEVSTLWDPDSGSLAVDFTVPEPGAGEVAAVSAELWRAVEGGEWELVAGELPPGASLVDPIPPVGVLVSYKVQTVSAMPSTAESAAEPLRLDPLGWVYLSAGPGWADMVKVRDNVSTSVDWGVDTAVHPMAGRSLPLAVQGEAVSHSVSVSARLAPDPTGGATWAELKAFAARNGPPVCYRDPKGRRLFGLLSGLSVSEERHIETGSFTVTEIDYTEGAL